MNIFDTVLSITLKPIKDQLFAKQKVLPLSSHVKTSLESWFQNYAVHEYLYMFVNEKLLMFQVFEQK